jgi:hypothetical protein
MLSRGIKGLINFSMVPKCSNETQNVEGVNCHDRHGLPPAQAQEWLGRGLTGRIRGAKPELLFYRILRY